MEKEKKNGNDEGLDNLTRLFIGLGAILLGIGVICKKGLNRVSWKNPKVWLFIIYWFILASIIVFWNYAHLRFLHHVAGDFFTAKVVNWMASKGELINTLVLYFSLVGAILFMLGLVEITLRKKYQHPIEEVGLKNAKGDIPQVQKIINLDRQRTLLKVSSPGIAPPSWEAKKEDLAFGFKRIVDKIEVSKNKEYIDIYLSKDDLPDFVSYSKYEGEKLEPFNFIVGESKDKGLITYSIRSCPHILMGGVSGYGKSTAYKLMIYSLLANTPPEQIRMSLLDLKRGVEASDFNGFPNVSILKTEAEAVSELESIVAEMHKRYKHLEEIKKKKIDPKRDKMPIFVVAVDEASVIFGARSRNSSKKEMADRARELCEEIAKLGRAAGIHMILATQKATKTSIDANTLENLEARLCFRTRTVSGSNAILGTKQGSLLPDIQGRAIWQKGGQDVHVQIPYIGDDELQEKAKVLCALVSEEYSKHSPKALEVSKEGVLEGQTKVMAA